MNKCQVCTQESGKPFATGIGSEEDTSKEPKPWGDSVCNDWLRPSWFGFVAYRFWEAPKLVLQGPARSCNLYAGLVHNSDHDLGVIEQHYIRLVSQRGVCVCCSKECLYLLVIELDVGEGGESRVV